MLAILTPVVFVAACNPFAPALEEGSPFGDLLGDPATIDGFFYQFSERLRAAGLVSL